MSHFDGQRSSSGRGGRGGRGRGTGGRAPYESGGSKGRFTACRNYISTGSCSRGDHCSFSHAVKLHASIDGSNAPNAGQQQQYNRPQNSPSNGFNNKGEEQAKAVSSVALWEDSGALKIFSGSYDGYWRLWNTAANFSREFEHCMSSSAKVSVVQVCSPYLYVAFEAPLPGIVPSVGMVHVWNLLTPHQPPIELILHRGGLAPYANGMGVSTLLGSSDGTTVLSGGKDGTIAVWSLVQQAENSSYQQSKILQGHAREVTALLSVVTKTPTTAETTVLWSSSIDNTIRLWDVAAGTCFCVLSSDTKDAQGRFVGHTNAVTALRLWESGDFGNYILSAGLDGCIKAWSTEAVLVASSSDSISPVSNTGTNIGVVCMAISQDTQSQPLLLCGLTNGEIAIRALKQTASTQAFALLMTLNSRFLGCGHTFGSVRCLEAGPHSTFYSGGDDGKLNVWQVTGDFGLL